jgi:hypothetical protein
MLLALVREYHLKPDEVSEILLLAGYNILNPIRYPIAENELQAKFSDAFSPGCQGPAKSLRCRGRLGKYAGHEGSDIPDPHDAALA